MRGMSVEDYQASKDELSEKWVSQEISTEVFVRLRGFLTDAFNNLPDPRRPDVLPARNN